jgi:two-component system, sensor histidine kinase and response regulator
MIDLTNPVRVLCMDDDAGLARLLQKRLERLGYQVDVAHDGTIGLAMYDQAHYDVLAIDQNMPGCDGLGVISQLAERGPLPPVIMVTGSGNEAIAVQALKLGAEDYVVKDVDGGYLQLLPSVIEQVIARHRLLQEKQQAEAALRRHAIELEARNEELDAFAHTVAHDLKSPLSIITGYAELLKEHELALTHPDWHEYLTLIAQTSLKISSIVSELLLLAEVRKAEITLMPLNMAYLINEARCRLIDIVTKQQAEISLPEPADWPVAMGYGPWIEEVWFNYLSNAIKYGGQPPRVEVGVKTWADGQLCFWVRDNGLGLTPEAQARLFTPFTRLNQVRAKGHGLGLSIVRRIVESLGGRVGVESGPDQGSRFYFTLKPAMDHSTADEAFVP